MSEIKNGGLDQYGAEPFKPPQFGTSNVEGVKATCMTVAVVAQPVVVWVYTVID